MIDNNKLNRNDLNKEEGTLNDANPIRQDREHMSELNRKKGDTQSPSNNQFNQPLGNQTQNQDVNRGTDKLKDQDRPQKSTQDRVSEGRKAI